MFKRNGMQFQNEAEYNEWAIGETLSLIRNTQSYYAKLTNILTIVVLKQKRWRLVQLCYLVMRDFNIKDKEKNIIRIVDELLEEEV